MRAALHGWPAMGSRVRPSASETERRGIPAPAMAVQRNDSSSSIRVFMSHGRFTLHDLRRQRLRLDHLQSRLRHLRLLHQHRRRLRHRLSLPRSKTRSRLRRKFNVTSVIPFSFFLRRHDAMPWPRNCMFNSNSTTHGVLPHCLRLHLKTQETRRLRHRGPRLQISQSQNRELSGWFQYTRRL